VLFISYSWKDPDGLYQLLHLMRIVVFGTTISVYPLAIYVLGTPSICVYKDVIIMMETWLPHNVVIFAVIPLLGLLVSFMVGVNLLAPLLTGYIMMTYVGTQCAWIAGMKKLW